MIKFIPTIVHNFRDLDEDIEVLILDPDELDNLISSGDEILDAKTVTAWFRAKQFLDKL